MKENGNYLEIYNIIISLDWKVRYDAITSISEFLYTYQTEFQTGDSTKIVKLFDVFFERMKDSNSKVNIYALQTLKEWITVFKVTSNFIS